MKVYKDKNINVWLVDLGIFHVLFYKWGFGLDKREYLKEFNVIGYKNIFRIRI